MNWVLGTAVVAGAIIVLLLCAVGFTVFLGWAEVEMLQFQLRREVTRALREDLHGKRK